MIHKTSNENILYGFGRPGVGHMHKCRQERGDFEYCRWEAQCGRQTKINWTTAAHCTHGCTLSALIADARIVVWLPVEQSAHRRHQLAVAEQSVTTDNQQHDVNT